MKFKESKLAHKLLDGMKGIEIGGAAHNPFNLDTINVDVSNDNPIYMVEQRAYGNDALTVDVIANGDNLPFDDKSFDFVISSHVLEHFINPIKALIEWERVARKYIFMIIPHAVRTGEAQPMATLPVLMKAYEDGIPNDNDRHHYGYTPESMREILRGYDFDIYDPDDKVGNGFTVVIRL